MCSDNTIIFVSTPIYFVGLYSEGIDFRRQNLTSISFEYLCYGSTNIRTF